MQSFRDTPATVGISVTGDARRLRNLVNEQTVRPRPAAAADEDSARPHGMLFSVTLSVTLQPHSYQVFRIEQ